MEENKEGRREKKQKRRKVGRKKGLRGSEWKEREK